MTLPVSLDDLYEVIIQLLAVFGFPVVVSLVNRNDKPLVRAFHIFNKFTFRALLFASILLVLLKIGITSKRCNSVFFEHFIYFINRILSASR